MYNCLFTFRSVTTAMRGSRALEGAGITALMVRTPKYLRQKGCGYSLRVEEQALSAARQVLAAAEIPFQRLYCKRTDRWQEAML